MLQGKLTIENKFGAPLNDLFGIFFEDLNHAADGGLYAEMVQNRSFEFEPVDHPDYHETFAWTVDHPNDVQVRTDHPLNSNNKHYLAVNSTGEAVKIANHGFNQGMDFQADHTYLFSVFIAASRRSFIQVILEDEQHHRLSAPLTITTDRSDWQKHQLVIRANRDSHQGRLIVEVLPDSQVNLDMISLFPTETFHHRKNGVRKDLGDVLAAMQPKFMRFPGGCLVHDGTLNPNDRESMYRWKKSIGPVEQRPTRRNKWGYNQTLGLGFYEYFQLAEDLGAKPLPVLPGGYDPHHKRAVPIDQLQPWIDDALDLIEFANGDQTTKWGKKRAELGHPEPFNLEYLAIGNEEVGQPFFDRYPYFHQAIRQRYPEIKLINTSGPFASGSEFNRGWKSAKKYGSDFVDEHYYMATDWFLANQHRYDHYDPKGPKAFLGEYASKENKWINAVVEASYMLGLERNADKVGLACYAPLFCNVDYPNWTPDLIFFNQYQVSPSVNYYVQQLFMNYQGTRNVPHSIDGLPTPTVKDAQPIIGQFGFEGDLADVTYQNVTFIDHETNQQQQFKFKNGRLAERARHMLGKTSSQNYSLTFDATRTGGRVDKGFHLIFGQTTDEKYFMWVLGGWENQDSIIKQRGRNHTESDWNQCQWTMKSNHQYHFEIHVNHRHVATSIDGQPFNDIEIKPTVVQPLYSNLTVDEKTKRYYLKLVNVTDQPVSIQTTDSKFQNGRFRELLAQPGTENQIGQSNKLKIKETQIATGTVTVQPYSVNVLIGKQN
ncbi:alpha-L-arabinofuranosidase C-terminal domain-containing protein [Lentilactobacillus raoultii]|uniref:non-reducing end alpha-L-arabinofuranosidase n=1 Tax=Lentilactobacillus raoultii TaxID=1987503 RepID=A0ABW3PG68_9LACO|nr:alpha-L-arabinofuranosidase C-terminal domain-containing protein [Lentilactobacillus raoultii]